MSEWWLDRFVSPGNRGLRLCLHRQTAKTDRINSEVRVWYRSVDCRDMSKQSNHVMMLSINKANIYKLNFRKNIQAGREIWEFFAFSIKT